MLQQKKPQDFVIGSGKLHSVRDFLKIAFTYLKLDYRKFVIKDKKLYRENDKYTLKANIHKANRILKWKPKINFKSLIKEMVFNDIKLINNQS